MSIQYSVTNISDFTSLAVVHETQTFSLASYEPMHFWLKTCVTSLVAHLAITCNTLVPWLWQKAIIMTVPYEMNLQKSTAPDYEDQKQVQQTVTQHAV